MLSPHHLKIYEQAKRLNLLIYGATKAFPKSEMYGITQQVRRASVSVGANIAEGCGKNSKSDLIRFFVISSGSIEEVKYFLETSKELGYLSEGAYHSIYSTAVSLSKQLTSFIRNLR